MRRWNGWGDSANDYPLKPAGAAFLEARLGAGQRLADADLDQVLASVPASRLAHHPLVDTAPETRVRHARGQSLADWLAMRSGTSACFRTASPSRKAASRSANCWTGAATRTCC